MASAAPYSLHVDASRHDRQDADSYIRVMKFRATLVGAYHELRANKVFLVFAAAVEDFARAIELQTISGWRRLIAMQSGPMLESTIAGDWSLLNQGRNRLMTKTLTGYDRRLYGTRMLTVSAKTAGLMQAYELSDGRRCLTSPVIIALTGRLYPETAMTIWDSVDFSEDAMNRCDGSLLEITYVKH